MKIVRSFSAPVPEATAIERLTAFLTKSGYRQLPVSGNILHFRRGSVFGAISNFNPTRWSSDAIFRVTFEDDTTHISAEIEITTDPTEKQFAEELLNAEFPRLVDAVIKNEFSAYDTGTLRTKVSAHVKRVVGLFGGSMISVILGIGTGQFCSKVLDISILTSAVIGFAVLLFAAILLLALFGRITK